MLKYLAFAVLVITVLMSGCGISRGEFQGYAWREGNHTMLMTEMTAGLYVNRPVVELISRGIRIEQMLPIPGGGMQAFFKSARMEFIMHIDDMGFIKSIRPVEYRPPAKGLPGSTPGLTSTGWNPPTPVYRQSRSGTTGW